MPRPWPVRADLATAAADREKLAVESPKWHQLVADLHERISGHNLKYAIQSSWSPVKWFQDEIQKRGLQWQKDVRQPSDWNSYLAARAKPFMRSHRRTEESNALTGNEKIPRTFETGYLPFFEPPPGS
jgi:hypothetical protein